MNGSKEQLPVKAQVDVLVVGGGNAALCAAITAREQGANVLLLESSPEEFRGGNSRHTRNLRSIHRQANSFLTGPYLEDECFKDLLFVTKGNTDEEMARFVIQKSEDCVDWMQALTFFIEAFKVGNSVIVHYSGTVGNGLSGDIN